MSRVINVVIGEVFEAHGKVTIRKSGKHRQGSSPLVDVFEVEVQPDGPRNALGSPGESTAKKPSPKRKKASPKRKKA